MIPAWLTWARGEIGTREVVGAKHNARVVAYWDIGKVELDVNDDETPWCAAFACAAIESAGYRSPRTGRARGFEPGVRCLICDPFTDAETHQVTNTLGAIVVLSSDRGPASGHVGFLEAMSPGRVHLLGGNQGNQVSIASFPADRVVHVLWPAGAPAHTHYPLAPSIKAGATVTPSDR